MTPKQKALQLLEARKKATDGKWEAVSSADKRRGSVIVDEKQLIARREPDDYRDKNQGLADHEFIATAANDIESVVQWALEVEKKLQRFITLSNGLSFYVRDEYQKSRLQMTDSVDLVEQIEKLYAHQCDAELSAEGEK